jgi:hypothetical protein
LEKFLVHVRVGYSEKLSCRWEEWVHHIETPFGFWQSRASPALLLNPYSKFKTTKTMNTIEITGAQIFRLRILESARPYADTSKLKGETYSRVSYNGTVFTINDKDPFITDLKNGKVHTAFLLETQDTIEDADGEKSTVKRLAFDGYANNAQMIGMTKTNAVIDAITKGSFKPEIELSEEALQELEGA